MVRRSASTTVGASVVAGCLALVSGSVLAGSAPAAAAARPGRAAGLVTVSLRALGKAPTFTLRGYIDQGSRRTSVVVHSAHHGGEASGSFTNGRRRGQPSQTLAFVRIHSTVYIRANQRFWAVSTHGAIPRPLLRVVGGHWVMLPSAAVKSVAGALGELTDPGRLASLMLRGTSDRLALGPVKSVRHVRARAVVARAEHVVLYVSLANDRPVEVQASRAVGIRGALVFGYPRRLRIAAPAHALPLSQLERRAQGS